MSSQLGSCVGTMETEPTPDEARQLRGCADRGSPNPKTVLEKTLSPNAADSPGWVRHGRSSSHNQVRAKQGALVGMSGEPKALRCEGFGSGRGGGLRAKKGEVNLPGGVPLAQAEKPPSGLFGAPPEKGLQHPKARTSQGHCWFRA